MTHLFNGMPPLHHRSPGPVAACLRLAAAGSVVVELIGDGVHLDAETVRMVFDLVGAGNIALVTDSMAATGLPDGDYVLGPSDVVVRDGVATLRSNGALAGGTATLLEVVRTTIAAGVQPGRCRHGGNPRPRPRPGPGNRNRQSPRRNARRHHRRRRGISNWSLSCAAGSILGLPA